METVEAEHVLGRWQAAARFGGFHGLHSTDSVVRSVTCHIVSLLGACNYTASSAPSHLASVESTNNY